MSYTSDNFEWDSISHLKPQLTITVNVSREFKHGEFCYILTETRTRHKHIVNTAAYQFVGRCNGLNTVQQIWDDMQRTQVEAMLTQQEILALLNQLHGLDLLQLDSAANSKSKSSVAKGITGYMLKLMAPLSFVSTIFIRR